MRLITIQHKDVFKALSSRGEYIASFDRVPQIRQLPYRIMRDYYNWYSCPVFCAPIGKPVSFYGCGKQDTVALQLSVPNDFVKLQYYDDWCDVIYFTEFPEEFEDVFDLQTTPSLEVFTKRTLDFQEQGSDRIQATLPIIKSEWITHVSYHPEQLLAEYEQHAYLYDLVAYDTESKQIGL